MTEDRLRSGLLLAFILGSLGSLLFVQPYGLNLALAGFAGVGLARFRAHKPPKRDAWRVATAVVLIAAVLSPLLLGVDWLDAVTALVLYLQVHRLRTGRSARDTRFSLLFAVMVQLTALHRSEAPGLAAVLLMQVALLPALLWLAQLQAVRERNRAVAGAVDGMAPLLAGLGALSAAGTALLFVLIPRLDAQVLAQLGERQDLSGFSEQVELGELGEIKDNPERVMQVRVLDAQGEPQYGPFYFRGLALTQFDGRRWTLGTGRAGFHGSGGPAPELGPGMLLQEIELEPLDRAPIFAIAQVVHVDSAEPLTRQATGDLRFHDAAIPRQYSVVSDPNARSTTPGDLEAALQLPEDLDPRILALAQSLGGGGDWATAAAAEQHLRQGFTYTLVPEPDTRGQPLSTFLFDSHKGHCEYYATALAVLLRAEGVPARVVNGFYGGEPNPLGGFLTVRQSDAHSWVEAWIGGSWVRLDATPAAPAMQSPGLLTQIGLAMESRWRQGLLAYDLDRQLEAGRALAAGLSGGSVSSTGGPKLGPVVFAALGLGVGLWLLVRLTRRLTSSDRRPQDPLGRHFAQARRLVARRGWELPPGLPPLSAAEHLIAQAGPAAEPLQELAWMLYQARYGGQPVPPGAAKDALRRLKDLPRRDTVAALDG